MRTTIGNIGIARSDRSGVTSNSWKFIVAAMVSGGLGLSGLAHGSGIPQASIEFERGELASAEGLEDLHDRVLRAASKACRMHGTRGIARMRWEAECREEMVRELLVAIDSERLRQFHAQRSGQKSADAG
ncbi:MAG: UrcA family protein [Gammaproteobacteria bacterium]|nr:UrcA family protein [Gammaproteobacteria bacterium]